MKLIAMSEVPIGSGYMHLGYLAATRVEPNSEMVSAGLALAIGGLVATRMGIGWGVRARRKGLLFRGALLLVILGVLGLVAGVGLVKRAYSTGKVVYQNPHMFTSSRMWSVRQEISRRAEMGEPISGSIDTLRLNPAQIEDGWFRPFALRKDARNPAGDYVLMSSGPDGRFDTEDDLREGDGGVKSLDER